MVKFGSARKIIHYTIFVVILLILIFLTIAILIGCCDRDHSDKICSKSTGATCLLIAIVLMFSVFSLVVLVGLFYFVMGLITYQGACAPFENPQIKSMLNRKDSVIKLNRDTTKDFHQSNPLALRMSTEIGECLPNETIFSILLGSNLYDIENKLRVKVIHSPLPEPKFFPFNSLDFNINLKVPMLLNNNFRDYHSEKFTKFLCDELTPVDLTEIIKEIFLLHPKLWTQWGIYDWARIALQNEAVNIQKFYDELVPKVLSHINEMRQILLEIDKLVLYKSNQFDKSLQILKEMSTRATIFMRDKGEETASELRRNVTIYVDDQVNNYIEMVISECLNNVGKCAPLAYIYYRSVAMVCDRLINPMNGFWVGLLLCGLLFLPIVFLAHHLQCLYRKMYQYTQYESQGIGIIEGGCARCTAYATPFRPGFFAHQPHYCVNGNPMPSIVHESALGATSVAETEAVLASNTLKRKQE
ncbi:GH13117 [Drosophila grimshawi]|uniref:GH13117 n=2 Tax=Drosophila grimshawi TaxID=7222 RepID=B4JQU2_DROGR|nr:GH13117 [Drosophila grimshawi]